MMSSTIVIDRKQFNHACSPSQKARVHSVYHKLLHHVLSSIWVVMHILIQAVCRAGYDVPWACPSAKLS